MKRFWISWYWTSTSRNYPNFPFEFWSSGMRCSDNADIICAIIDAPDEETAKRISKRHFRKQEERFCEEKPIDWLPNARFQS